MGSFGVVYAYSGECRYVTPHADVMVTPGTLYCSYPLEIEKISIESHFHFFHFFFEDGLDGHPMEMGGFSKDQPTLRFEDRSPIDLLMAEINQNYLKTHNPASFQFFSNFYRLIHLSRRERMGDEIPKQYSYTERIQKVFESQSFDEINISILASALGVTPQTLLNACRREVGVTTQEYLNILRINKAKSLLRETDYKIAYVAAVSGFRQEKYFMRCFRAHTSLTPSEWRLRHRSVPAIAVL